MPARWCERLAVQWPAGGGDCAALSHPVSRIRVRLMLRRTEQLSTHRLHPTGLWPSTQSSSCSPRRKAEMYRCANQSFSVRFTRAAIRRIGSVCCARAASGQVAADPSITLMKSRRRIAFPQSWASIDVGLR